MSLSALIIMKGLFNACLQPVCNELQFLRLARSYPQSKPNVGAFLKPCLRNDYLHHRQGYRRAREASSVTCLYMSISFLFRAACDSRSRCRSTRLQSRLVITAAFRVLQISVTPNAVSTKDCHCLNIRVAELVESGFTHAEAEFETR